MMTDEMMSLGTLLEKSADADLLREMIGFAAHRLTNASSRLIEYIGLPTFRAPGAPRPGWSHHTPEVS